LNQKNKPGRPVGEARLQVATVPVRQDPDRQWQVLLITSRETHRWVIPKGWPMKGRTDAQAAAREAFEEAGVEGRVRKKPVGKYQYWKRGVSEFMLCEVTVFLLEVKAQLETWPEKGQRRLQWFPIDVAAQLVEEPGLSAVLSKLETRLSRSEKRS
jgi:8-oxo-dGTP pyrophosphatase MutT (NUDIX family)